MTLHICGAAWRRWAAAAPSTRPDRTPCSKDRSGLCDRGSRRRRSAANAQSSRRVAWRRPGPWEQGARPGAFRDGYSRRDETLRAVRAQEMSIDNRLFGSKMLVETYMEARIIIPTADG